MDFGAPLVFLGTILYLFGKENAKYVGQIVFGFGSIFLGMSLMSSGAAPLKQSPFWLELLASFGKNPILGVLAGTFLLQLYNLAQLQLD